MTAAGPLRRIDAVLLAGALLASSCGGANPPAASPSATPPPPPWILLVTLDTTRADAVGPDAAGVETPAFNALVARGRRFLQAYATVPETLPSHASMLTGLLPAGHGVHQNARVLAASHPVLAERLRGAGYRTAALVSSFVLARRFGLARGFDVYDDAMPEGRAERPAAETTERALALLAASPDQPLFLWVHYFDPHAPYLPPEPFRRRYAGRPYLGEVAAMDEQLGRLVAAFETRARGPAAIAVAADHGEGLGEHGESQHGNLLYQSTMHVPLVLVAPGLAPGAVDTPVSTRRLYDTILALAGIGSSSTLLSPAPEIVIGEAMRPFLAYGWQPQAMAVDGRRKAIRAGTVEVYDVVADPAESHDLAESAPPSREARNALLEYPTPSLASAREPEALGVEERRQLASLGYVSAGATPVARPDAPRPVDRAPLLALLEEASGLFVREEYAAVVPLLRRILAADPGNLDAALRLGTAYSALGQETRAEAAFDARRRHRPGVARRPRLPRAALRARSRLEPGGAAARAGGRRGAGPPARARGPGPPPAEAGAARGRDRPASEGLRAP